MRVLLVVVVVIIAIAAALIVPVMIAPQPRELSSTPSLLHALARVPADAEQVFLIPSFGSTYRMLRHNRLTRESLIAIAGDSPAVPLLIGNSDVVLWRTAAGGQAGAFEAGFFRRLLIMAGRTFSSAGSQLTIDGNVVYFGEPVQGSRAIPDGVLLAKLGKGSPGNLFMLQMTNSKGSFPNLQTPALTSLLAERSSVRVVSRGLARPSAGALMAPPIALPSNAVFAAAVSSPPKIVRTLDRILPLKISPLLDRGGVISIYKVETGRLVPKIEGALAVPGASRVSEIEQAVSSSEKSFRIGGFDFSRESSRTVQGVTINRRELLGTKIEYATSGDELLLAFDKKSIEKFLEATPAGAPGGSTSLLVRFIPRDIDSILSKAIDHPAFGFLSAEERTSLQNAATWIHRVRGADAITAEWKRDADLDTVVIELVRTK